MYTVCLLYNRRLESFDSFQYTRGALSGDHVKQQLSGYFLLVHPWSFEIEQTATVLRNSKKF